ncbi:mediator of RNA polymerase II transcription subunit 19-like [Watersipora subatra]|uniref:mediator of RNA polymerase II transcription subunit 19-like n=1 Tax=Watersipora subatra TaxID=2589382 RepID=UPI00355B4E46
MASFDSPLKTSPKGGRSPQVVSNIPRQDSSGTLKTTIFLGRNPTIVPKGPFYLCKDLPEPSEVTGSMNLIHHHGLQNAYAKFCGKKMKEELSSVLSLPGSINLSASDESSSLRSLIDRPPITGKELVPLSSSQLAGFRLHPGQLPEQHRLFAPQKKPKRSKLEVNPGTSAMTYQPPDEAAEGKRVREKKKSQRDKPKKRKDKKKKKEKDKGSP